MQTKAHESFHPIFSLQKLKEEKRQKPMERWAPRPAAAAARAFTALQNPSALALDRPSCGGCSDALRFAYQSCTAPACFLLESFRASVNNGGKQAAVRKLRFLLEPNVCRSNCELLQSFSILSHLQHDSRPCFSRQIAVAIVGSVGTHVGDDLGSIDPTMNVPLATFMPHFPEKTAGTRTKCNRKGSRSTG